MTPDDRIARFINGTMFALLAAAVLAFAVWSFVTDIRATLAAPPESVGAGLASLLPSAGLLAVCCVLLGMGIARLRARRGSAPSGERQGGSGRGP